MRSPTTYHENSSVTMGRSPRRTDQSSSLSSQSVPAQSPTAVPPVLHEALNLPPGPQDVVQLQLQPSQASSSTTTPSHLATAIQAARGSGYALPPSVCLRMGQSFGVNFNNVKIHTDQRADWLNQTLQADALTTGQDIFFRQGAYNPDNREGQALIAHELTHVVQQYQGRVKPTTQIAGVPVNDDPSLEQASDQMGQLPFEPDHVSGQQPLQHHTLQARLEGANPVQMARGKQRLGVKSRPSPVEEDRQTRRQYAAKISQESKEEHLEISRQSGTFEEGQAEIVNDYPAYNFSIREQNQEERHKIFVGVQNERPILMIASIPLPISTFILEMKQRFIKLETEYNTHKIKNLRGGTKRSEFDTAELAATTELTNTNNIFGDLAKTHQDKLQAEQKLALALGKLIQKVNSFAKRLGSHWVHPSYAVSSNTQ